MNVFEEVAKELDKGAPRILYRQDLAAILRRMAAAHGEDERVRKDAARYRRLRHKMTCGSFTAAEELAVLGAKTADAFDAAADAMNGANG